MSADPQATLFQHSPPPNVKGVDPPKDPPDPKPNEDPLADRTAELDRRERELRQRETALVDRAITQPAAPAAAPSPPKPKLEDPGPAPDFEENPAEFRAWMAKRDAYLEERFRLLDQREAQQEAAQRESDERAAADRMWTRFLSIPGNESLADRQGLVAWAASEERRTRGGQIGDEGDFLRSVTERVRQQLAPPATPGNAGATPPGGREAAPTPDPAASLPTGGPATPVTGPGSPAKGSEEKPRPFAQALRERQAKSPWF